MKHLSTKTGVPRSSPFLNDPARAHLRLNPPWVPLYIQDKNKDISTANNTQVSTTISSPSCLPLPGVSPSQDLSLNTTQDKVPDNDTTTTVHAQELASLDNHYFRLLTDYKIKYKAKYKAKYQQQYKNKYMNKYKRDTIQYRRRLMKRNVTNHRSIIKSPLHYTAFNYSTSRLLLLLCTLTRYTLHTLHTTICIYVYLYIYIYMSIYYIYYRYI
jgi:hypothetical protein